MNAPGFAVLGLDHLVLRVTDMERAIAFYRDVLGGQEERRLDQLALVQIRLGRSLIDLVDAARGIGGGEPPSGPERANMHHFCLRIEPFDAVPLRRHLEAHGIAWDEPAERYGADGHGPSIYIRDPDGNQVELKGPPHRRVP
ncbi:MAG: VOC family protein [Alphaproteobacteria bacterium]|nr:VOC family protein [Alphaproteobacteria bacterium]